MFPHIKLKRTDGRFFVVVVSGRLVVHLQISSSSSSDMNACASNCYRCYCFHVLVVVVVMVVASSIH